MKKIMLSIVVVIVVFLVGCYSPIGIPAPESTSTNLDIGLDNQQDTPNDNSTQEKTYEEEIAALDSEYADKLLPISQKYQEDLASWNADHDTLVSELEYLQIELLAIEDAYNSEISSLRAASASEAAAAGKKAYNEAYSKATANAGGYGSSYAVTSAQQAQLAAENRVREIYNAQISEVTAQKKKSMSTVESKITLQNSKISNSMQKKQTIEETYQNSKSALDAWYETQKNLINTAYGIE